MSSFESLDKTFDVPSAEIVEVKKNVDVVATSNKNDVEQDYKYARAQLTNLVEKMSEALDGALEVAQESDHPRAYEVAFNGAKSAAEVVEKISDLHKKMADLNKEETKVAVNPENINDFLGIKKFKYGEVETENKVGIVTGLAWTEFGGEILKIETVNMPGKGRMQITGKLGDVMQESVKAAKSFVRSKSLEYGIIPPIFEKKDFHIHVPEGATPKDGPSAGIAMVTSIVSSITNIPVNREIAMTGEVTVTGQVLPIGGLKEKLLAAHRAGVKKVLIPKDNEKDLIDVPKKVREDIKIIPVESADEVLKIALIKQLKPIEWAEVDKLSESKKEEKSQASIQ